MLEKLRHQKLLSAALLIFTLSIGILIGTLINTAVLAEKGQAPAPDATPLVIPSPAQLSTAFSQLAKQLEPAVVNITSSYGAKEQAQAEPRQRRRQTPQDEEEDPGMDFFRRFFGSPFGDFPQRPFRRSANGSGFVVDKNGYILTNLHVVEDADRIRVRMNNDAKDYDAKLIGADTELDVAVLKIDAGHALAPAQVGNSEGVQVGDWVVAIGSPFGLEATVTAGIISAKGREVGDQQHQLQKFLQTDAAINPGNSGGPLINLKGEVVGINTAIATETGTYNGIGFALPINMAVHAYNQIIKTGKVSRGGIGVTFRKGAPQELLKAYGATQGVFIDGVNPDGPAAKAGVKPEDIIVSLNGQPIKDGDDLISRVSATPVGTVVTVSVLRDGKKMDFHITVGERAEIFAETLGARRGQPESTRAESPEAMFGFWYRNLRDSERERLGYADKGGVVVTRVDPNSFAEDIGVAQNDIITAINRQPVASADDVRRIQGTLKPGQPVAFRILRPVASRTGRVNLQPLFLAGTLPEKP
jgi:serine protease Do